MNRSLIDTSKLLLYLHFTGRVTGRGVFMGVTDNDNKEVTDPDPKTSPYTRRINYYKGGQ